MSDKVVSLSGKRNKKTEKKEQEKQIKTDNPKEELCCSFCHRPNTEVLKLVKGPGVNICSECAMIAVQYLILNEMSFIFSNFLDTFITLFELDFLKYFYFL